MNLWNIDELEFVSEIDHVIFHERLRMTGQQKIPINYISAPSLKTQKRYGLIVRRNARRTSSRVQKDENPKKRMKFSKPAGVERAQEYINHVYGEGGMDVMERFKTPRPDDDDIDPTLHEIPYMKVVADDIFPFGEK